MQPITVKIFTLDFTAAVITFNMLNADVKSSGAKTGERENKKKIACPKSDLLVSN